MPSRAPAKKATTPRRASRRPEPVEVVDLDLDAAEEEKDPSFVFRLGGRTFRCRNAADLHWDTIEKWLIANDAGVDISVNIDPFFAAVIHPDDYPSFVELKQDPQGPLTVSRATTLLQTINREVLGVGGTADPTSRPASSEGGSSKNGSSSKVEHDGRVTHKA